MLSPLASFPCIKEWRSQAPDALDQAIRLWVHWTKQPVSLCIGPSNQFPMHWTKQPGCGCIGPSNHLWTDCPAHSWPSLVVPALLRPIAAEVMKQKQTLEPGLVCPFTDAVRMPSSSVVSNPTQPLTNESRTKKSVVSKPTQPLTNESRTKKE